MSRENHSLQVALVIFAMLTVVLGVASLVLCRHYQQAAVDRDAARRDAGEQRTAAQRARHDAEQLKGLIGAAASEDLGSIEEHFTADMRTCGAGYPEPGRSYRAILQHQHNVIRQKSAELADAKSEALAWKARCEEGQAAHAREIQRFKSTAAEAAREALALREAFTRDRHEVLRQQDDLTARLAAARQQAQQVQAGLQNDLAALDRQRADLARELRAVKRQVESERDSALAPDGRVRHVDPRSRIVEIDRGRSDALRGLVTFEVYSADPLLPQAGPGKAVIEVSRILGDHSASARIIRDKIADPILPGDPIHSAAWSPGRQVRFALVGGMDLDGDGHSDVQTVRNLVTANGGAVDCLMDDRGAVEGSLSALTRFLVLGEAPDEHATPAARDAFSRLLKQAGELGIERITLARLLEMLGWREPMTKGGVAMSDFTPRRPAGAGPAGAY